MKYLIIIAFLALGVSGKSENKESVTLKFQNGSVWLRDGSVYAEYVGCSTGPAFCMRKSGWCSLYPSGAYKYKC